MTLQPDFIGLGYEMSALASGELQAGSRTALVELIRGLGGNGVVRLGGIVADFTRYEPQGASIAHPKDTRFNRADIESLWRLLAQTDWQLICSVNFAQGTIEDAVQQVRDLAAIVGPKLLAIQLGNEVDQYPRGVPTFRPSPYRYDDYRVEYRTWRAAIERAVPDAPFASPDVAVDIDWVERAAAEADGDLRLLPVHYYRAPARFGAESMLLEPDPRLDAIVDRVRTASRASGIPWRMVEANSFSEGGLPGTSDSIVGALWLLDFLALLASRGAAGVNVQTGVNQLGFVSGYSPLRWEQGRVVPGIPYLGMRAFALASEGCDGVGAIPVGEAPPSITAYGFYTRSSLRSIVLVNRSDAEVVVTLDDGRRVGWRIARLEAPDVDDPFQATLGGARVSEEGRWTPTAVELSTTGRIVLRGRTAAVLGI